MRNRLLFLIFGLFVGVLVSTAAFERVLDDRSAQRAIVDEFVAGYCHPDPSVNDAVRLGGAAALSRVAIKSGAQPFAWAEYLKCKAGL